MTIIVFTAGYPGYWGKGESFDAAVRAAEWLEEETEVLAVECEPDDYIDDGGTLCRHGERKPVMRGKLGLRFGKFFHQGPLTEAKPKAEVA